MEWVNKDSQVATMHQVGVDAEKAVTVVAAAIARGEQRIIANVPVRENSEGVKEVRIYLNQSKGYPENYFLNKYILKAIGPDGMEREAEVNLNRGHFLKIYEAARILKGGTFERLQVDAEGKEFKAILAYNKADLNAEGIARITAFRSDKVDKERVIAQFRFDQLKDPVQKETMFADLRAGNYARGTIDMQTYYVTLAPRYNTANIFDAEKKLVVKEARDLLLTDEARKVKELRTPSQKNQAEQNEEKKGTGKRI